MSDPSDPDSTLALLSSDLPSVQCGLVVSEPGLVLSPTSVWKRRTQDGGDHSEDDDDDDDDSEDEVFLGKDKSLKEHWASNNAEIANAARRSYTAKSNQNKKTNSQADFTLRDGNIIEEENEEKQEEKPLKEVNKMLKEMKESAEKENTSSPASKKTKKSSSPSGKNFSISEVIAEPFKELNINAGSPRGDRSRSPLSHPHRRSSKAATSELNSSNLLQSIEEDKEVAVFAPETSTEGGDLSEKEASRVRVSETPPKRVIGYCPITEDISSAENSPVKEMDMSLNSSTQSQWFNNTHDELVLFEKYGDDYDNVVNGMNTKEKRELKRLVSRTEAKDPRELVGDESVDETFYSEAGEEESHVQPEKEKDLDQGDHVVVSESFVAKQLYDEIKTKASQQEQALLTPTPKPRTVLTPKKAKQTPPRSSEEDKEEWSPRQVESAQTLQMLRDDLAIALSPNPYARKKSPIKAKSVAGVNITSPPRELKPASPDLPPSRATPSPKAKATPSVPTRTLTRATPSTQTRPLTRATPKVTPSSSTAHGSKFKTPMNRATPLSQPGSAGYRTPKPKGKFPTPLHSNPHRRLDAPSYLRPTSASKHRSSPRKDPVTNKPLDITICSRHGHTEPAPVEKFHHRKLPASIDMKKIVSPVSQYIKRNPARQIRPSPMKYPGHEFEDEEEEEDRS